MNEPLPETPPAQTEEPEANQPGLGSLRETVATVAERRLPTGASLKRDGVAGLTVAISSVPDGMAGGLLAGVNPMYGLNAMMAGPIVGGILSSTWLMVINNTSAVSLVAGQALVGISFQARDDALFLMVVLAGVFQILFGLFRLGRVTRFVSFSVMAGFLAGVAVILVLSQLPTVTGYAANGANRVAEAFDLLANLEEVHLPSLGLAIFTVALILGLSGSRVGRYGSLVGIAVPTLVVVIFGIESVRVVRDVGEIEGGFPMPFLPSFSESLVVLTGAFSVAVVGLVQGAGVSQSVPNPDGSRSNASRDFVAQGAANVASGLFRGLPVGGSLGATALNVAAGARRRWAAISSGLWMALIVIALPGLVSRVVMPSLGALLILAGIKSIKPAEVASVWHAGWPSRLAGGTTFLATLFLPIQAAVGLGVVLSALLFVSESSTDVSLVEVVKRPDGRIVEGKAPSRLPGQRVTVLDVYGHLFYAGARTLANLLPRPYEARNPVVILRLRGRNQFGATLVDVLSEYAESLRRVDGRLYVTGIGAGAHHQLLRTGKFRPTGPVRAYEATPVIGESTERAHMDAEAWLVGLGKDESAA